MVGIMIMQETRKGMNDKRYCSLLSLEEATILLARQTNWENPEAGRIRVNLVKVIEAKDKVRRSYLACRFVGGSMKEELRLYTEAQQMAAMAIDDAEAKIREVEILEDRQEP